MGMQLARLLILELSNADDENLTAQTFFAENAVFVDKRSPRLALVKSWNAVCDVTEKSRPTRFWAGRIRIFSRSESYEYR